MLLAGIGRAFFAPMACSCTHRAFVLWPARDGVLPRHAACSFATQGMRAVAVLGRIHLDSITDLAWSPCGAYLAISSRDGFCTLAAFSDGDLGERVPTDRLPQHLAMRLAAAAGKLPPR